MSELRLEWIDPRSLDDNPRNWRRHPKHQRKALDEVLDEVGWAGVLLYNEATNRLIDGHLRKEVAIARGEGAVPVLVGSWSEEQERLILATLDPIAALAETDRDTLRELVDGLDVEGELERLVGELAGDVDDLLAPDLRLDDLPGELPGVAALKQDVVFPSDLPWDIPPLRPDMLAGIPEPLDTWAGPDVCTDDGATWWLYNWGSDSTRGLPYDRTLLAFYVDDARFENFWFQPDVYVAKVLNAGVSAAITPNFSLWRGVARATHLYNTYRSRWVGRYMQEAGIKVIPDVNWAEERSFEFCLLGIPRSPPAIAVQIQTVRRDDEVEIAVAGLRRAVTEIAPGSLLVYGGPTARAVVDEAGVGCRVVFAANRVARRRQLMEQSKQEVL